MLSMFTLRCVQGPSRKKPVPILRRRSGRPVRALPGMRGVSAETARDFLVEKGRQRAGRFFGRPGGGVKPMCYQCSGCGRCLERQLGEAIAMRCPCCRREVPSNVRSCPACGMPIKPRVGSVKVHRGKQPIGFEQRSCFAKSKEDDYETSD